MKSSERLSANSRKPFLAVCLAAAVLFGVVRADAHEIGTTRVTVAFPQSGSYEIEVVTDAAALVDKLETLSGQAPDAAQNPTPRTAEALHALLCRYDEMFRRRVVLAFDGNAVRPETGYAVAGETTATTSPVATIKLKGDVPARSASIRMDLLLDICNLFADRPAAGGAQATDWLEGGQRSSPLSLAAVKPPPSRRAIAATIPGAGFYSHRSPRSRSHALCAGNLFGQPTPSPDPDAGQRLHDRALDYFGA